jgi:hypothetical protein
MNETRAAAGSLCNVVNSGWDDGNSLDRVPSYQSRYEFTLHCLLI